MPPHALRRYRLVFDLIYNPLRTALLRDAARAGATTLNGMDMFLRQAAMQFQLWTGRPPDLTHASAFLEAEIERRSRALDPKD
jgi:shikimate dehydrogenase